MRIYSLHLDHHHELKVKKNVNYFLSSIRQCIFSCRQLRQCIFEEGYCWIYYYSNCQKSFIRRQEVSISSY